MVKTYSQLYLDARRTILLVDDSQSAAMVARQLLCFVSGKTQEQILSDRDLYASEDISAKLDACMVNSKVDYEAPFDVNDSFATVFEAFAGVQEE